MILAKYRLLVRHIDQTMNVIDLRSENVHFYGIPKRHTGAYPGSVCMGVKWTAPTDTLYLGHVEAFPHGGYFSCYHPTSITYGAFVFPYLEQRT